MPHKEATKREVLNLNIDTQGPNERNHQETRSKLEHTQRCHKKTKFKLKWGWIGPSSMGCPRSNIYLYLHHMCLVFNNFHHMCLVLSNFHHMCFILSNLKCYESATLSFRNHLWSAKKKEYWKNNKKKNIFFNLQNVYFLFFFSFDPSYFQTS